MLTKILYTDRGVIYMSDKQGIVNINQLIGQMIQIKNIENLKNLLKNNYRNAMLMPQFNIQLLIEQMKTIDNQFDDHDISKYMIKFLCSTVHGRDDINDNVYLYINQKLQQSKQKGISRHIIYLLNKYTVKGKYYDDIFNTMIQIDQDFIFQHQLIQYNDKKQANYYRIVQKIKLMDRNILGIQDALQFLKRVYSYRLLNYVLEQVYNQQQQEGYQMLINLIKQENVVKQQVQYVLIDDDIKKKYMQIYNLIFDDAVSLNVQYPVIDVYYPHFTKRSINQMFIYQETDFRYERMLMQLCDKGYLQISTVKIYLYIEKNIQNKDKTALCIKLMTHLKKQMLFCKIEQENIRNIDLIANLDINKQIIKKYDEEFLNKCVKKQTEYSQNFIQFLDVICQYRKIRKQTQMHIKWDELVFKIDTYIQRCKTCEFKMFLMYQFDQNILNLMKIIKIYQQEPLCSPQTQNFINNVFVVVNFQEYGNKTLLLRPEYWFVTQQLIKQLKYIYIQDKTKKLQYVTNELMIHQDIQYRKFKLKPNIFRVQNIEIYFKYALLVMAFIASVIDDQYSDIVSMIQIFLSSFQLIFKWIVRHNFVHFVQQCFLYLCVILLSSVGFKYKILIPIQLLLVANISQICLSIFNSVFGKMKFLIYTYGVLLIFAYTIAIYINQNMNYLEIGEGEICQNNIDCFIYLITFGFKDDTGLNQYIWQNGTDKFAQKFIVDIVFRSLIILFQGIILSIIVDSFQKDRKDQMKIENQMNKQCIMEDCVKTDCHDGTHDFHNVLEYYIQQIKK